MPVVREIVRDAQMDGYRFDTLILEVVKSDPFQMNSKSGRIRRPAAAPGRRP